MGNDRSGGDPSPGRPAGTPLGRALAIPAGTFGDRLRAALAAVDRVHGVGDLTRLPVAWRALEPGTSGDYRLTPFGTPDQILINPGAERPEIAFVHELGHFLDHQRLGDRDAFASLAHPRLAAWRAAVHATGAVRNLAELAGGRVGRAYAVHADYLGRETELWARGYAQYVATRGGDATLLAQLGERRARPTAPGVVYIPYQWDDDDFAAVAATIDDLFRGLGWIA